jgi:hypothetical protein
VFQSVVLGNQVNLTKNKYKGLEIRQIISGDCQILKGNSINKVHGA